MRDYNGYVGCELSSSDPRQCWDWRETDTLPQFNEWYIYKCLVKVFLSFLMIIVLGISHAFPKLSHGYTWIILFLFLLKFRSEAWK